MIVVFGAIMYFLMIRPQQKRMKAHQNLVASLEPGSRVLLTSGMYATIVHAGERQFIVELAPGTEVTVLKGSVTRVVTTDEEEFEFDDAATDEVDDLDVVDTVEPTAEELKAMFDSPSAERPTGPYDTDEAVAGDDSDTDKR